MPETAQAYPDEPVTVLEPWPPGLPLEHHQLVTQRDVLQREIALILQRGNGAPRRDTYLIPHPDLPSLNREKASNLTADEVFAAHRAAGEWMKERWQAGEVEVGR